MFPLAAAAVALAFAARLARQYASHRRPYQLAWTAALLMYSGGSFALFLGVLNGWSTGEYRAYWLLGAVLNVPYLVLGETYLLFRDRRAGNALLLVVLFATAFALNRVRTAPVDVAALAKDLPLGKDAWRADTLPYRLGQIYPYSTYAGLLVGFVWSLARMRRVPELRGRFLGTLWIAVGATIVAVGSGVGAGLDVVPVFSVGLLAGVAVMFWGFLRVSRPVPTAASARA